MEVDDAELGTAGRLVARLLEQLPPEGLRTYPGVQAEAQGLAAYETWRAVLARNALATEPVGYHARWLARARGEAATFAQEIRDLFPETAAAAYGDEVEALKTLGELADAGSLDAEKGTRLVDRALEHERAALAALRQALDES